MEVIKINDYKNYKIQDAAVIKRIIAGEKELFEILLRRNNQKLYRVIRGYISDIHEIDDIMQNTYLKAFEKLYQFKMDSEFSTWLIRIGINEALARLKEKTKYADKNQSINLSSNFHFVLFIWLASALGLAQNQESPLPGIPCRVLLHIWIPVVDPIDTRPITPPHPHTSLLHIGATQKFVPAHETNPEIDL